MGLLKTSTILTSGFVAVLAIILYSPVTMGCMKIVAITISVCVVGLSIHLYTPLPQELSQRWQVQTYLMVYKTVQLLAGTLAMLGVDSKTNIMRKFVHRGAAKNVVSKSDPLLEVTDTTFDGVKVRIYRPKNSRNPCPALMYYHGGGWTYGNADLVDNFMTRVTKAAGIVLIAVELAPEHPFPVPFEDCVTATLHLLQNGEKYGVNSNEVAIGGGSAGGNLAAAVALFLKNNPQYPNISLQYLFYPCLQPIDFKLPSYISPTKHAMLPPQTMAEFWSNYFGPTSHPNLPQAMLNNQHTSLALKKSRYADLVNAKLHLPKKYLGKVEPSDLDSGNETLWKEIESKALNPYMSPLLASDLDKVAPAVVVTAEHDILRDEGIMYAERLRKSGVKVKHRNYNMLHGFASLPHLYEIGRTATNDFITDIKEHFGLE